MMSRSLPTLPGQTSRQKAGIRDRVLTDPYATPLIGKERSLAMEVTSFTMAQMIDGQPLCCKRAPRTAVRAGVAFLRGKLRFFCRSPALLICHHMGRNRECAWHSCAFYPGAASDQSGGSPPGLQNHRAGPFCQGWLTVPITPVIMFQSEV
jgi:hypothetical protein